MIIRRFILPLLGALWLAGCSAADDGADIDWPPASPALWQVTAPEGQTGWLFGAVHALPAGVKWRTPVLDDALAASGELVVEIANLGDRRAAQSAFAAISRAPGQPPLSQRVALADRPALAALMQQAGMDDAAFANIKSWAAGLMLASAARTISDPAHGVDRALIASSATPVTGLESFARQYQMFDQLSPDAQSALLGAIARDAALATQPDRIITWLTGDLDRLELAYMDIFMGEAEMRQSLLTSRNLAWSSKVSVMIRSGKRPFVAVGAAHLVGADGLPALLEAQGFTIMRLQ